LSSHFVQQHRDRQPAEGGESALQNLLANSSKLNVEDPKKPSALIVVLRALNNAVAPDASIALLTSNFLRRCSDGFRSAQVDSGVRLLLGGHEETMLRCVRRRRLSKTITPDVTANEAIDYEEAIEELGQSPHEAEQAVPPDGSIACFSNHVPASLLACCSLAGEERR
jgi:hypothetical protein